MKRATLEQAGQPFGAHRGVPHLQFQVGDDRAQVGVAAALAVAVHAALHVRGALFDGGERVGHRQVGIVMRVDADDAVEPLAALRRRSPRSPPVMRAAVGVAQAKHVGARVLRGFQRAQREVRIRLVAVEEVLGVVDDFLAVLLQVSDGLGDDLQVLFFGDAERPLGVQVPALAEDRDRPACPPRPVPSRSGPSPPGSGRTGWRRKRSAWRASASDRAPGRRTPGPSGSSPAIRLRCSRCPAHPASGQ